MDRCCPVCGETDKKIVLDLGSTPLEDALQSSRVAATSLEKFPLQLARCLACHHAFLPLALDAEESYGQYFFASDSSPGLGQTLSQIGRELWAQIEGERGARVLDLGSNDGTLLDIFRTLGADVLGVEPSSNQSAKASSRGIPTIKGYFTHELVDSELKAFRPKILTIHNVLANVANPVEFLRLAAECIDDSGIISIVTGYHPDQFSAGMFDWIYHEHLSYFSAKDVLQMAEAADLQISRVRRLPYKGGSLHIILQKKGSTDSQEMAALVAWERWAGLLGDLLYLRTEAQIDRTVSSLADHSAEWERARPIVGYGSSHSTTTLLHALSLGSKLDWIVDDNAYRHGLFSPGFGQEILSPDTLLQNDEALVIPLAWQHDWRIRQRLERIGFRGQIMNVMPEFGFSRLESL